MQAVLRCLSSEPLATRGGQATHRPALRSRLLSGMGRMETRGVLVSGLSSSTSVRAYWTLVPLTRMTAVVHKGGGCETALGLGTFSRRMVTRLTRKANSLADSWRASVKSRHTIGLGKPGVPGDLSDCTKAGDRRGKVLVPTLIGTKALSLSRGHVLSILALLPCTRMSTRIPSSSCVALSP